ncbi:MAG: adenylate/guanylate cyclase domain-containing protein, partial [SAR324 cluster bacterium]|nr:adenylate/guanylate cyclase domain-containing protein [SAR324 cluster bacterium]
MAEKSERKVAVILATDVVGYSSMMEENEDQTLKNLKACRSIIEGLVEENHGRIFNTAGDSVLAEFQSAVEAVICASEFQKIIKERNDSVGEEEQMQFRVGINMGDVVIEGENLYGDGVNVAARLEALAQPGGVCLSKNVHEIVNKKTDFHFNDLGEQKVKNTLLHAVDVVIDETHQRTVKTQAKSKTPLFATIAAVLILSAGGFAYYQHSLMDISKGNIEISDKPTVLIMPFSNMSGKAEQDYIGMGMTSHIITMLSQFDKLLVLAKQTGEHIQTNKISNEKIVKQYGVKYVLNGTTQASGDRLRINVELTDLNRNSVIWSEVYDFKED